MEEVVRIRMPEGSVPLAEMMGDSGPDVDLHDFESFRDQVAQDQVEVIRGANLLERRAGDELVSLLLEGQAITAEAVIIDVRKQSLGDDAVGHDEPARLEQRDLVGDTRATASDRGEAAGSSWRPPRQNAGAAEENQERNKKTRP